jgi:hypothetical protein
MSVFDSAGDRLTAAIERPFERPSGGRRGAATGGFILIALGLFFLVQQNVQGIGELFLLALGLGFFAAYLYAGRGSGLVVPAGVLTGLGLGVALSASPFVPGFLDGPVVLGSWALGFLAIALFEPRHRWALWPAAAFGLIAAITLAAGAPPVLPGLSWAGLLWPVLLIAGGLWLLLDRRT